MGMFDDIQCRYPLPIPGANERQYQTKSISEFPRMDEYEIREDGTLWHKAYDVEDRSDPNAEGIMRMCGCMTRVNERWEPTDFTGEILFYDTYKDCSHGWIEWSAYFVNGKLQGEITLVVLDKGEEK